MKEYKYVTKYGGFVEEKNVDEFVKQKRTMLSKIHVFFDLSMIYFIEVPLMMIGVYLFFNQYYISSFISMSTLFILSSISMYSHKWLLKNTTYFIIIDENKEEKKIIGQLTKVGKYSNKLITK